MTSSDPSRHKLKYLDDYSPRSLLEDGMISKRLYNFLTNECVVDIRETFNWNPRKILSSPQIGRKTFKQLMDLRDYFHVETTKPFAELSNKDRYEKNLQDLKSELSSLIADNEKLPKNIAFDEIIEMKSKIQKIKYRLRKVERTINIAELEQYLPNWEYDGDESYAAQKIIELVQCIIDISISNFRTKEILGLRLGLADERPPLTLQQIGSLYGLSRERIRQLVNKGFRNLNNHLKRHPTVEQLALEKLSIEIFSYKDETPLNKVMLFCDKYYQSTINLAGLTSIIMVNMRLFTDIESRVQIKAKFKKLLTEKKKEALDLLKHENFLAKWANAFDGIYYPENVKIFEAKDLDFERLRTPNEESIGLTGSFFSQKNNREVLYESSQEHLIFQTMERLDNIVWYQEQPLKIPYNAGGYQNYYFPDLAVLTKNGRCIVVEVKLGWHFVLEISLRKTLAAIDFLHPKGIAFVMLDSRGQSLRNFPITNNSVISREKKLLRALDKYGDLKYIQYKHFLNGDLFSTREFVGFIVRNDLSFSLKPFNLTRLPKGLSFSSLI